MKRFNAKYAPFWYHPDHLGSSSYITNLSGEINQHMEYLPFGELLVEEHLNSYNSPFKFNAKEFDAETGNYYYGARYYDPKWSLWLSVDPFFAKYPTLSPYAYVANNPIKYIDPNGKEIVIRGSDGKTITYSQSMNYDGNDKFIGEVVNQLNNIYSVEQGGKVLDYMVSDNQVFTITNETINVESAVGVVPDNSAGTLKLGNTEEIGINTLSHELFHGYQNMKGQGGTSIKNEVEAYLFGDLIERLYFNLSEDRISTTFESGNFDWFQLSRDFTEKSFSKGDFQKLVNDFKENSGANDTGIYKNFPLIRENQSKNLYEEFHPKFE